MSTNARKALLLDRDGVINVNHGYVHKAEDCEFVEGIFDLCAEAQIKGYAIIIVTNQSGVARKYYSEHQFQTFSRWIEAQFSARGISVSHTYHCPHHPKISGHCLCRKPRPGMLFKAAKDFGISLSNSIMVGDSRSDITCARAANVGKAVLFKDDNVDTAHMSRIYPDLYLERSKRYYKARNLSSITRLL